MNTLGICHHCPKIQPPPYSGKCVCTISGLDILEHAKLHVCPLNKFRRGLGDWIHLAFKFVGIVAVVNWWTRWTKKPCGCGEKREHINSEWDVFWKRARFKPY